jgi:hypothetical protein
VAVTLFLSVDDKGVVSLWDTPEQARDAPGEAAVDLQLTEEQEQTLRQAQQQLVASRPSKPRVKLIGEDSNVFNLLGICTRALRRNGQADKAAELMERVKSCNYDGALCLMMEYCDVE